MPAIPCQTNRSLDQKELCQLLLACKQTSVEKKHAQIVSISLEIDSVDPLSVLNHIKQPDQLHFYFEKKGQGKGFSPERDSVAIAAVDSVQCFTAEGSNRFLQAKGFIDSLLKNTIAIGNTNQPFSGPHFFCSFTFFDENSSVDSAFSPATIFLPRWQVVRHNTACYLVANLVISAESNVEEISAEFWQQLKTICSVKYEIFNLEIEHRTTFQTYPVTDTQIFKDSVTAALHLIQSHYVDKIVLAHALNVISPIPFQLIDSLHNLRQLYPDCYIFSIGNCQGQQFIGASPERLVSLRDRQLLTDALAGSAPRGQAAAEDASLAKSLLSSEKEMHEHQLVIDFITQHLQALGLDPQRSPARLLQLSNIQHLQTPIRAQVPDALHLLEIVAALHPTPAVAGKPRNLACQQIRQFEGFERSLYAAPIGWVDHQGNGEFVVGIRSALIDGCRARLYGGAGIVAGSDPEKELAEVQLKLQALLAALI